MELDNQVDGITEVASINDVYWICGGGSGGNIAPQYQRTAGKDGSSWVRRRRRWL